MMEGRNEGMEARTNERGRKTTEGWMTGYFQRRSRADSGRIRKERGMATIGTQSTLIAPAMVDDRLSVIRKP